MGYTKVTISTPNDLLIALSAFAAANNWTVLAEGDDLAIDGSSAIDGKRLVIRSPGGKTFAHFRSANGMKIFPSQNADGEKDYLYGLGLTCSTEFTEFPASGRWYDQVGVTRTTGSEPIGVGIPLHKSQEYNVYFNHVADPSELLLVSAELFPGVFQHIAVGETYKIGSWTGGTIYSASRNSANMFVTTMTQAAVEATSGHLFAVNAKANTFLRANIDSAPLRTPEVLWAGAGPSGEADAGYTGKRLALPVFGANVAGAAWQPNIPHYRYLQSQSADDTGRNVNTLNCISVNLPLAVYVLRDPDGLANFSQCGYVPGLYFISTRNVSAGGTYNINYPSSGDVFQAFPHTSRGGVMGYDGFSVKQ
ncbi:hypothetical protein [Acetonema longum]|uniref:Uncharacterized protein n=1 Tax=Acetonema longum DSM 6540 TaxID=1009370 RepID=F7NEA7_9FIRM|nr:hypothetical protein [Acetonema longum]EGO65619.1 hypothetical protein ALO_01849 [Acetonema longum DSM 6540]